jgi:hypothetical protein
MNRHNSNWSAMGSGETNSDYLKVKSVDEIEDILRESINPRNFVDSWDNIVSAMQRIRENPIKNEVEQYGSGEVKSM